MRISGITWQGDSVDDTDILRDIPPGLVSILGDTNGVILYDGALHIRGACLTPDWHSLRAAWRGPSSFHTLYENALINDIPFAQDQVGDQFLIRDAGVIRLSAETGDVEPFSDSLETFFTRVSEDIEGFLNVGLGHNMQPGQLLLAWSAAGCSLKPVQAGEVIQFHADLARKIRDLADGGQVTITVKTDD